MRVQNADYLCMCVPAHCFYSRNTVSQSAVYEFKSQKSKSHTVQTATGSAFSATEEWGWRPLVKTRAAPLSAVTVPLSPQCVLNCIPLNNSL